MIRKEPELISIEEWSSLYEEYTKQGLKEPPFGGNPKRHLHDGDYRLSTLKMDNSPESLNLWNFLLTEETRLKEARKKGTTIVGTMKDLGTIPLMAYALDNTIAFYPDGAWWIPCIMELSAGLFQIADSMGIDESFCPVRAMLGAFANENHFPRPDVLFCSTGAVCDDFSAIAQRLEGMGFPIHWWEVPRRSATASSLNLPGGNRGESFQLECVIEELQSIRKKLEATTCQKLTDEKLRQSIKKANKIRQTLEELRSVVFNAPKAPLPALEMLICEMLIIHYCSDAEWALTILKQMLTIAQERVTQEQGYFSDNTVKVFWINPVADLKAMNLLEESGGRVCGTEYLFTHALDQIPEDKPPMEALAQMALTDPMIGPTKERGTRIIEDMKKYGAQALIISKIPGASHCAIEGTIIAQMVQESLGVPTLEIEVPPLSDSLMPALKTRIEALIETASMKSLF